jgi:hypothetical protein
MIRKLHFMLTFESLYYIGKNLRAHTLQYAVLSAFSRYHLSFFVEATG